MVRSVLKLKLKMYVWRTTHPTLQLYRVYFQWPKTRIFDQRMPCRVLIAGSYVCFWWFSYYCIFGTGEQLANPSRGRGSVFRKADVILSHRTFTGEILLLCIFDSKTDHPRWACVSSHLLCDDFSTNLTIRWMNEVVKGLHNNSFANPTVALDGP